MRQTRKHILVLGHFFRGMVILLTLLHTHESVGQDSTTWIALEPRVEQYLIAGRDDVPVSVMFSWDQVGMMKGDRLLPAPMYISGTLLRVSRIAGSREYDGRNFEGYTLIGRKVEPPHKTRSSVFCCFNRSEAAGGPLQIRIETDVEFHFEIVGFEGGVIVDLDSDRTYCSPIRLGPGYYRWLATTEPNRLPDCFDASNQSQQKTLPDSKTKTSTKSPLVKATCDWYDVECIEHGEFSAPRVHFSGDVFRSDVEDRGTISVVSGLRQYLGTNAVGGTILEGPVGAHKAPRAIFRCHTDARGLFGPWRVFIESEIPFEYEITSFQGGLLTDLDRDQTHQSPVILPPGKYRWVATKNAPPGFIRLHGND